MSLRQYLRARLRAEPPARFADPAGLEKATLFVERFREIVSDPVNLLISRVPQAGYVDGAGHVILHNGNRVPRTGPMAYYEDFSDILVINRGVHEPLEEYCFQQVLAKLGGETPVMLELGCYWAHYSMWFKRAHASGRCFMVEPDKHGIKCGQNNFAINGLEGEFIPEFVGRGHFTVDGFMATRQLEHLTILHCDIQGNEEQMLEGAEQALTKRSIDYLFISTHAEDLHTRIQAKLREQGYRIETESGFDTHTTGCDGFVLATSPLINPVFRGFRPLGRTEISYATPAQLLESITGVD
jgi:Methyltransferase FkbM domain